jgi:glycosyltransferase involved in cell wall biosynthesis
MSKGSSMTLPSYVLITPARNEARFIELTIKSVVAQTVRSLKWAIVSDGSTDGTDEIVSRYAADYPWIELVRTPERAERHFAGKVHAFNAGYARVRDLEYDIIGSVDADISFGEDYFSFLLQKLAGDPALGLVGTPFREGENQVYDYRFSSVEHVSGACQLFRRECFETIGGYMPMKGGGIDLVAVVTARMKGWQTRTFTERVCLHHRKMNSAMNQGLKLNFKWGQSDYRLGGHPAWELFRCFYQMRNRPYVAGGMLTLAGYYYALLSRRPRSVSAEFVEFRGKEQMQRLKEFFVGRLRLTKRAIPVAPGIISGPGAGATAAAGQDNHK